MSNFTTNNVECQDPCSQNPDICRNMNFRLFPSAIRTCGDAKNVLFSLTPVTIISDNCKEIIGIDHTPFYFSDGKRSKKNSEYATCVILDFDNNDNDPNLITNVAAKLQELDCHYVIVPSRSHMKDKEGEIARPKIHVYLPCSKDITIGHYKQIQKKLLSIFPTIDTSVSNDTARFLFGNSDNLTFIKTMEQGEFIDLLYPFDDILLQNNTETPVLRTLVTSPPSSSVNLHSDSDLGGLACLIGKVEPSGWYPNIFTGRYEYVEERVITRDEILRFILTQQEQIDFANKRYLLPADDENVHPLDLLTRQDIHDLLMELDWKLAGETNDEAENWGYHHPAKKELDKVSIHVSEKKRNVHVFTDSKNCPLPVGDCGFPAAYVYLKYGYSPEYNAEHWKLAAKEVAEKKGLQPKSPVSDNEIDELEPLVENEWPVHALPESVRAYVQSVTAALKCNPALIATPLLAMLSYATSQRHDRVYVLDEDWEEAMILWTAVVARPGSMKTSAIKQIIKLFSDVRECESNNRKRVKTESDYVTQKHKEQRKRNSKKNYDCIDPNTCIWYEACFFNCDVPISQTLEATPQVLPPLTNECISAVEHTYFIGKFTIEGLHKVLSYGATGHLTDELRGMVCSFGQYKPNGEDADLDFVLKCYDGNEHENVTRVTKMFDIPRCSVNIAGAVQASTLRDSKMLSGGNGLAQRFLFSWPKKTPALREKGEKIPTSVSAKLKGFVNKMFGVTFTNVTYVGDKFERPANTPLVTSLDAYQVLKYEMGSIADTTDKSVSDAIAGFFSKLRGHIVRISGTLHTIKCYETDQWTDIIDAETMQQAVEISRYFGKEVFSIYPRLSISTEMVNKDDLQEILDTMKELNQEKRDGCTARDIYLKLSKYKGRNQPKLYELLDHLVMTNKIIRIASNKKSSKGKYKLANE